MKDIHLGTIKPLAEPRPADKPGRKEQTGQARGGQQDFARTLESVTARLDHAKAQGTVPTPEEVTPSSIREQVNTLNKQYDEVMSARQSLAQLYHSMKAAKAEDKG